MDDTETWALIHAERASTADLLAGLAPDQWDQPSLCGTWTVRMVAAHMVTGAEQTKGRFLKRMVANGFRFNTMMDRDARRLAERPTSELVERLRATTTTTNGPPAPVVTMLGEIVVHTGDIRLPLGLGGAPASAALVACLDMYKDASFPIGSKKRIEGLRLVATDVGWTHGSGPEVSGPGMALVMAITGRSAAAPTLSGDGAATLQGRLAR